MHRHYDAYTVDTGHQGGQRDRGTEQNNGKIRYNENVIASATYRLQRRNMYHTQPFLPLQVLLSLLSIKPVSHEQLYDPTRLLHKYWQPCSPV